MNERIKELLVKAIKEVGPDDADKGAKEKTLAKFAELIINECINVIQHSDNECHNEWDYAERDLVGLVKQHFGAQ